MMRPPVTLLALFLVPFVAYAVFVLIARRQGFRRGYWRLRTLMTLAIVGLLLVLGNLLYLAQFSGAAPGSTYEPAHIEDGRLVPGRSR
jgi:Family of unknown function (DUF6111)